uniref:Rho GTPase activating protein 31 n=1 Tax=Catharus ustulatus TaxID=91951 RepID=A0A8C3XZL8_CATUS
MKNKGAKPKLKRKGAASAFGCDLTEYLESSGQDVPYVLKSCAEFIETHGIVDGIYRLSGVTSNIQKLRQEFVSDQCPDLTREVYLQDIHCVGSLCKLYFRELPNPLLTYELYKKFTEAVSRFPEDEQLARIQNVIQELPPSHYRTLEYLIKHLTHLASFSNMTNMHTRNLALVWAPNLLRSKEIEAVGCNGDAAFLEVRVQQLVIEFILNHVDQIFNKNRKAIVKSLTLPSASLPMKLVSLEEAQARSLSASHPARKERRENSLPEIVPVIGSLFHTVVDLPDSKRKLSTKSKKWKSIFNLGRSGSESKSKLSRNGSVFVRAQKLSEKATVRPAKSMDSLCSLPVEGEDDKSRFKRSVTTGGFFVPTKIRTGGTGSSYDLSKENEWEREGSAMGAKGSSELGGERVLPWTAQVKSPPEQLKVFRVAEDAENEQTSAKGVLMFYTSERATKSGFPSSLFPLEASPHHQRKALNISEPFAVSVPLRVSAVISTNSTPCRVPSKEKHSLSSLEELSSLVESMSPSALEARTHTRAEQEGCLEKMEGYLLVSCELPGDGIYVFQSEEDPPNAFLEALWPEIQQELKIIEPEEELLLLTAAVPKTSSISESPPSAQTDSLSSGAGQSPALAEQKSESQPSQITQVPLFGASGMEQQDSLPSCQSDTVVQQNGASALPKLSTLPTEDGLTRVPETQREKHEIMTTDERDTFSSKGLSGAGIQEMKEGNAVSRTQDPADQDDEDAWTDNVQSLELVEPWEDHQWVTSPLHSPTFKDIQEKMTQEIHPQSQRADTCLSLRPRFSRSISLDSKDTVLSMWTTPFSFIDATDHQQPCSDILHSVTCELSKTQPMSPSTLGKAMQDENGLSPPEDPSKPEYPLIREKAPGEKAGPSRVPLLETEGKKVSEETPRKVKTRPSSLNLDSLLPAPDFFTFESLSMPSAPGNLLYGQKEVKSSDSVPSLLTHCPAGSRGVPWGSRFNAPVDLDLDYLAVAHATTGRRNSAPVSVSAVRTSFMIKMCQARAVPVIPPKIQYTQIPQPLQAQNTAPATEKKEAEAKQAIRQAPRVAWSHLEAPKSPPTEKKTKAEKENSDPAQKDSICPWHGSLGSPLEPSQSSHHPALDAPVLRRKRTSGGEAAGDNPQSSKIERPSGFSKPSYRSRPGRPQSLILFSPPFPIMDHPTSSADSRVLLSPIRSPTQTTSLSPICGDLSDPARTVPEGVTLRNKMTIPKNGQRLETSTSCFYQPQRRSVILDGRSGRQIE